jgi:hypothetical protein
VREKRRKKGRRARRAAASPEADELHHRHLMDDLRHPALLRFGTGEGDGGKRWLDRVLG